jgi:GntR family transcriptional regulator
MIMSRQPTDSRPLYIQLAHALTDAITANRFPVGSLLPTEAQLCSEFNVSRHTVREAIRHLRDQGLLSARRGVGTRVEARRGQTRYTQSLASLSEIAQYAYETSLDVLSAREITADPDLADRLGCRPGKAWLHIRALRRASTDKRPICWTDLYIDKAYAGVRKDIGRRPVAVYTLIEQRYSEVVVEVQQDIQAGIVSKEYADLLQAKANSPALLITRRYFGAGGRVIEVAINCHPADRFVYSMRTKREPS